MTDPAPPRVRPFRPDADMDAVLDIWVRASEQAHDFMPPGFWRARLPEMRGHYLPLAEVRVVVAPEVAGFAAVVADHLAALFVSPDRQGRQGRRILCGSPAGDAKASPEAVGFVGAKCGYAAEAALTSVYGSMAKFLDLIFRCVCPGREGDWADC